MSNINRIPTPKNPTVPPIQFIQKLMAKSKSIGDVKKVTFGARKTGKAKKGSGPKDKSVSKYRGQGR